MSSLRRLAHLGGISFIAFAQQSMGQTITHQFALILQAYVKQAKQARFYRSYYQG